MGMLATVLQRKSAGIKLDSAVDAVIPKQGAGMRFAYGNGEQPLAGYTIKRGVGIGGFGEVYFATNDAGKEVALKRIQKNLDVEVRGVKQCLNLRHPNLIGLYDIRFDDSGQGWIVMEYVAGDNLRDLLDHQPQGLPARDAVQRFGQIAAGVAYLHDQGIVHRDLKPANIFIDGGLIKIGDYGLSKFISCSRRGGQTESVGTFHYMAPEIGKGEYGKEIDIYALGIILFEMLTGNVPFDGESSQEIILKHLTADPDLRHLPHPYAGVVAKALAKNPTSRFRDVREMLAPLGLEIDSSGLTMVRSTGGSFPEKPGQKLPLESPLLEPTSTLEHLPNQHLRRNGEHHFDAAVPARPVFPTVGFPTAGSSNNSPNANQPQGGTSTPDMVFGAVRQHAVQSPNSPVARPFAATTYNRHQSHYREPVARAIYGALLGVQRWWAELPLVNPWRALVLSVGILILLINSGVIFSFLFFGFVVYIPYYIIWYLTVGAKLPSTTPPVQASVLYGNPVNPNPVMPQPLARPVVVANEPPRRSPTPPRPISFRQWQSIQRRNLQSKSNVHWLHELTGAMLSSTAIIGVLGIVGFLFAMATERMDQPGLLSGSVWTATMALLGSWTVLFLGKKWEHQTEDSAIFRFKQLTAGLVLGCAAFGLSQYLKVPWQSIDSVSRTPFDLPLWKGFYDSGSNPLLPAFVSYFALVLGVPRWWRQSESVRRRRFSIAFLVWSIMVAGLVKCLIYFPQPWGMVLFGSMSVAIQLSSPWIDSSRRFEIPSEPQSV